jgi:dTDP-4-amino-4,6-dideoxygalactose transaminase
LTVHGLEGRVVTTPDIGATYVLFRCVDAAESLSVRSSLTSAGVDHRLWYELGLQRNSAFAHVHHDDLSVTERIAPCLIGVPVAPDFSETTISYVVNALVRGVSQAE